MAETIDPRLALKPGDEVCVPDGLYDHYEVLMVIRDRVVLWRWDDEAGRDNGNPTAFPLTRIRFPPAPQATPGVVYRHKDWGVERCGHASGQLWGDPISEGQPHDLIPFTSDWLPVDPPEGRP